MLKTTTTTTTTDGPLPVLLPLDDDAASHQALRDKLADAMTPGFQAEFDPDEADRAGAFVEDALSEQDAAASSEDLLEIDAAQEPAFLDIESPRDDIPSLVNILSARELYDPRPGETVAQAAARKASGG